MTDPIRVCHNLLYATIIFILLDLSYLINADQIISEGPIDQQAKIGEKALLKCKIRNLRGEPQWCIDDFCLGVLKKDTTSTSISNETIRDNTLHTQSNLHLKGRPRYKIIGDRLKGEFHLLIEPVQLQDNMYFYCMVTAASETVKAVKSKKVFLTVLTHPQSLMLDNPVHVSLNKPSIIQCKAKQSRPPVKILISINGNLITDESKYKTEIIQYNAQYMHSTINLNTNINQEDMMIINRNKFAYISSISSISQENLRQSYYDTYTNLTLDDIDMKMQGQVVECFAYTIYNPSIILNNQNNNHRHHNNLNRNHNNFMSTKSYIQVDYAPEVNLRIVSSTNRILKEDDVINLICETKATPPIQSYKWYIGKSYLNGVSDPNLNLKLRREMHLKTITCEASNTVASVKASIQLKIQFKPSFNKGSKTYMMIDKSACNKPLTLDCQVNSNPPANITWFKRRLSQSYLSKVLFYDKNNKNDKIQKQSSTSSVARTFSFNFNRYNNDNLNDIYEDELIGTGPTYTIASFNCANLLSDIKNNTKQMIKKRVLQQNNAINNKNVLIKKNVKKRQLSSKLNEETDISYESEYPEKFSPSSYSNPSNDEDEEYYYDYDENDAGNDNEQHINGLDFTNRNENKNQENNFYDLNNDFGVYICEASNRLVTNTYVEKQTVKRYIKLNPTGAPILKVMPSSINSLTTDEMMSIMMKTSLTTEVLNDNQSPSIEIAASIGTTVSLTCLIEPLPILESIVWIKDNGKIIPNSRFSILESGQLLDASTSTTTNRDNLLLQGAIQNKINSNNINNKIAKNYKIKHENLTIFNPKVLNYDLNSIDSDANIGHVTIAAATTITTTTMSNIENQMNGVKTTDSDSIVLTRSVLQIKNIRKQDFGIYKCKSTNSYGTRMVTVLLREKTLMDKLNLNSHNSFILFIIAIIVTLSLVLTFLICLLSKRNKYCCCCCCRYSSGDESKKNLKEKRLLAQNMNQNKCINEWLAASSKLSNDSSNVALLNTAVLCTNNNKSSIVRTQLHEPLLNHASPCNINISNKSSSTSTSASSKTSQTLSNSPRHETTTNSSSLLNDDDNDSDCNNNININSNSNSNSNNNNNNISNSNDEQFMKGLKLTNSTFQTSQFSKYLISSPINTCTSLITPDYDNSSEVLSNHEKNKIAQMMIRSSHQNGNFNAKISSSSCSNTLNRTLLNEMMMNNGTLKRQANNLTLKKEKIFQETPPYRLSDLFNELSPNLITNNTTSTLNNRNNIKNNGCNVMMNNLNLQTCQSSSTPVSSSSSSSSSTSTSSSSVPINQSPAHSHSVRLLQTTSNNNSNSNTNNINKFPNPFNTINSNMSTANLINNNNSNKMFMNNQNINDSTTMKILNYNSNQMSSNNHNHIHNLNNSNNNNNKKSQAQYFQHLNI